MAMIMSNVPTRPGDMEIQLLFFYNPTMRATNLEIRGTIGPGFDLGWISSVTVSLSYRQHVIGEMTLEDTFLIPRRDMVSVELKGFEIRDMTGFKAFVRGIMPKTGGRVYPLNRQPRAAVEIVDNGHGLSIVVDLTNTGRISTSTPTVRLTGDEIEISFSMANPTAVEMVFKKARFILERDGDILANLAGKLNIECGAYEYVLRGRVVPNRVLAGTAMLKGYGLEEDGNTWFFHALREIEIQVDMGGLVTNGDWVQPDTYYPQILS